MPLQPADLKKKRRSARRLIEQYGAERAQKIQAEQAKLDDPTSQNPDYKPSADVLMRRTLEADKQATASNRADVIRTMREAERGGGGSLADRMALAARVKGRGGKLPGGQFQQSAQAFMGGFDSLQDQRTFEDRLASAASQRDLMARRGEAETTSAEAELLAARLGPERDKIQGQFALDTQREQTRGVLGAADTKAAAESFTAKTVAEANLAASKYNTQSQVVLAQQKMAEENLARMAKYGDEQQKRQAAVTQMQLASIDEEVSELLSLVGVADSKGEPVMSEKDRARLEALQKLKNQLLGLPDGVGSLSKDLVKAGDVQDGYRFKGGDPAKEESWEKVKKG